MRTRTTRFLAFGLAISAAVSPAFADPSDPSSAPPSSDQDYVEVEPVLPPSDEAETPTDDADDDAPSLNSSQPAPVKSVDPQVPTTPSAPPTEPLALPTGADKSGVTSKSISVPKGSGTIQGMEESFSAQLSTGIATFSVPFALPAARGGAQPSLGLSYSSSGGYGLAGVGWSIGVPFIARQTDRGVPGYADEASFHPNQDRFVFNGGQELVPICVVDGGGGCTGAQASEAMPAWAAGWQYFRPRVEGSFLRFFWSFDHLTWRVQDKSGVTMELGVPLNDAGYTSGIERNPDKLSEVYRWHLVRQYDTYGEANPVSGAPAPVNVVAFRYFQDGGTAYLSDIYDTPPATDAESAPLANYAHHTRLVYASRPDPTHSYRSGWRMEQNLRLARVDVASKTFTGAVTTARTLVRRYHLSYDDASHASLLASVQVEGRCSASEGGAPQESAEKLPETTGCGRLPAMEFEYSHVTPYTTTGAPGVLDLDGYEGFDERLHTMTASPPHSVDEELTDLFDVNADSLPDVLVTAAGVYGSGHGVFFNGAGGVADAFGSAQPMSIAGVLGGGATTITLKNANIAPLDLDGDGITDLLHMPKVKNYAVYSPLLTSAGKWTWQGRAVETSDGLSPKIDLGQDALDTQVMDVDFDGLVDVVITTGTEVQTYFSLGRFPGGDGRFGHASWTGPTTATLSTEPIRTCVPWSATPVRFSDSDIKTADMNGDGITDIVRVRKGDIRYWPGRGNGFWGTGKRDDCLKGTFGANRHVQMSTSPQYSDIQGDSLRLDDVNGDGLTDLVQIRFDAVDVWLNVDGKGWTERHIIDDTPPSPSYANRVRLVDVNGSGTRDVLWGNSSNFRYMDLAGGSRPSVLVGVKNGLGKSTVLEYSTSATEMLEAEKAGASSAWTTRMPTSVHVVKRVIESDNLVSAGKPPASYVTEYTYRDPVYEGRQREFRGFRFASARRIGDANSPTDITESTFLLGECKDEDSTNGVDDCAVSERWRDNPREALKGLPVISEKRDESGRYLSTDLTRYRLRKLYTGLDGREVRHAYEVLKDTYVYDVALFTPLETQSTPTTVETELAPPAGPVTELATTTPLTLRSTTGRRQIESSSTVDVFGNRTVALARGCMAGCSPADEEITTSTTPGRPSGDPTGWLWRTMSSSVSGNQYYLGTLQQTANTYDSNGALQLVRKTLANTLALDRFHATGGNVAGAPTDASADGGIDFNSTYDDFGNLLRESGPNSRCRDVGYDDEYQQLAVSDTIFRNGCASSSPTPFVTEAEYDRGLALVTEVTDIQSQPTQVAYDAFGRLSTLTRPDPTTAGSLSPQPTVKIEYFLPTDLGTPTSPTAYSIIHTSTQDAASLSNAEYLESWSYVDGMGRTLVTLSEADTTAGDEGAWIASGRVTFDAKGAVEQKFLDHFTDSAAKEYPLSAVPVFDSNPVPSGTQSYDAFGRNELTRDLDGTVTLANAYHALSTDMYDAADYYTSPSTDTFATERKDGHGRTVSTIERFKVGTDVKERETVTSYTPTGEPLTITRQLNGTSSSVMRWMRYDSLGRMVLNVEPDASAGFTTAYTTIPGTLHAWRYAYNDSGDLVGTSDARGCGVNFTYDKVGRLQYEDYSPCESHHLAYGAPNLSQMNGIEVYYHYDSDPNVITDDTPTNYFSSTPAAFLNGRLVAVYDMGAITVTKPDGRGRVIGTARKIAKSGIFASSMAGRFSGQWFEKTTAYDSADREVSTSTGASVTELLGAGSASTITTTYSHRGTVASASSSYGDLVTSTKRTADGLLEEIVYDDAAGTTSSYSYDERRRLESARTIRTAAPTLWTAPPSNYLPAPTYPTVLPSGQLRLQDDAITYDLVGNPTAIADLRDEAEWPSDAKPVDRDFEYDDFYRLTRVDYSYNNGSTWASPFAPENAGATDPRLAKPVPQVTFTNRIAWQTYAYDWLGNTSTTDDDADGFYDRSLGTITNSSTKPYQLASASNETTPGSPINKEGHLTTLYDAAGNLIELRVLRNGSCIPSGAKCNQVYEYHWDEVGRLVRARRWDVTAANINTAISSLGTHSAEATNTFDASDERVIEQTYGPGGTKQNVFVFDTLDIRRTVAVTSGTPPVTTYPLTKWTEVPYLFVNGVRLARVAYNDSSPEIAANETHVFLEIGDHLGSTSVVIDRETGELVERGTYQPYGGKESDYRPTRWQQFREEYGFTGKEEDVQVGLTYFGKRFLSPYLNRWVSADPAAIHALGGDPNVYAYVRGAALRSIDPVGLEDVEAANAYDRTTRALANYGMPDRWLASTRNSSAFYNSGKERSHYTNSWRNYERKGLYISDSDQAGASWAASGARRALLEGAFRKGVSNISHEATHRYLDKALDKAGKDVLKRAAKYYAGSGLYSKSGNAVGAVTDGERAAGEASAEYVAHRTQITLDALAEMHGAVMERKLEEKLPDIVKRYDARAAERRFGYDHVGSDTTQYRLQKDIPQELKNMLDSKVLDGRVGDDFSSNKVLQEQLKSMRASAPK